MFNSPTQVFLPKSEIEKILSVMLAQPLEKGTIIDEDDEGDSGMFFRAVLEVGEELEINVWRNKDSGEMAAIFFVGESAYLRFYSHGWLR
jgi:hypothetical protein